MKSTLVCCFVLGLSVFGVVSVLDTVPGPKQCPPCQIEKEFDPICVQLEEGYDVLVNPSALKCAKECGIKIKQVDMKKCKDLMDALRLDTMNDAEKKEFMEEFFDYQKNRTQ